jgi:hypothetical protein
LHALFLPTPFKFVASTENDAKARDMLPSIEALKPGALYSDCSVVHIDLSRNVSLIEAEMKEKGTDKKAKGGNKGSDKEEVRMIDDGEYGGEEMGRIVWESFERTLKAREAEVALAEVASTPA